MMNNHRPNLISILVALVGAAGILAGTLIHHPFFSIAGGLMIVAAGIIRTFPRPR